MFPRVYKEFKPSPHLTQYIKCYWRYEKEFAAGEFEHVFPDSSYELVFTPATYTVNGAALPHLFFVGQLQKPLDFYAIGAVAQWCIRFYPWGLQPFGDVEALANKEWAPASDGMNPDTIQHLETVMQSDDSNYVINKLDDYFTTLLLQQQFDDTVLQHAFSELKKQKGDIKVKDLADFCYISARQLTRKVTHATGKSPHEIASRLRFEQVRDAIMHNPDMPLTFLASEHGYTDQSHLIKEFRAYTDMTPSAYAAIARNNRPRMENTQNVLFLQFNQDEPN